MTQRISLEEYRKLPQADRRGKKKKRNQHEHDIQASFIAIIDLPANRKRYPFLEFIYAVPNAAKRNPAIAAMMLAEGMRAGVPDLVFPFVRRGYPGAYLENKHGSNDLSKAQIKFRDHLLSEGYYFESCYTVDAQIAFTEWYLDIKLIK
jgi:hypothetical protein